MTFPARVIDGRFKIEHEHRKRFLEAFNNQEVLLTAEEPLRYKTYEQLKAIHGPLRKGVQAYYRDVEGIKMSLDKVKWDLKCQFLGLWPRYHDDGTPKYMEIGGEKWHLKEVPSLRELSVEQADEFITNVIHWYRENKDWEISINPPYARPLDF